MMCHGHPNKTIAQHMEITERTVKTHLTSIYQKLDVTDRHQAIEWARRHPLD
jgi:DNA-binding NarL/FixJ family response regulator